MGIQGDYIGDWFDSIKWVCYRLPRSTMPIATLRSILDHALQQHYAVGYFEAWDQYSLEAVIEAAQELRSPAILGFGAAVTNGAWLDAGGVEELASLARVLAERASVPTAVLFNEAQTHAQAMRGLAAGCNCVMLDSSHFNLDDNIAATRRLVDEAHAVGAELEAELGHLPTAGDPSDQAGTATDPEQAAAFAQATGIDVLAVSIGNVHLLSDGQAALDLDRLERIRQAVALPLVLHGGTGIPAAAIQPAIARGVAKINYGTRLKQTFLAGVRAGLAALPEPLNIHDAIGSRYDTDIMLQGKRHMQRLLSDLIRLYGSAGRAPEGTGL
jgi:ketose-bisphosphate aldolase